jgi:F-type H+-transporting ATPase subunit alpha
MAPIGLALNLEETEVGAIILGDYLGIREGTEVRTTGKLLSVPVGKGLLGRVVDVLGRPLDGKGPIKETAFYPGREDRPGYRETKVCEPAPPDRHHGHRRHDPDRPRPARIDHW